VAEIEAVTAVRFIDKVFISWQALLPVGIFLSGDRYGSAAYLRDIMSNEKLSLAKWIAAAAAEKEAFCELMRASWRRQNWKLGILRS
jgi:hypothetical protein